MNGKPAGETGQWKKKDNAVGDDPIGWMWSDACEMLNRAERMHRQFFHVRSGQTSATPTWEPPVDVFETKEGLGIFAALPGVDAANVKVFIEGDTVIISGVRPLPDLGEEFAIHRLEIPHGRFERRIRVATSGGLELMRRDMNRGCLILSFRKLGHA